MGNTANASDQTAGVTPVNAYTHINNDYVYPGRTLPAMMRKQGQGLVRGWLYPMDVDQGQVTAWMTRDQATREDALADYSTASGQARQQAALERAQARVRESFAGTTVPQSSVDAAIASARPIAIDYQTPTVTPAGYDSGALAQAARDRSKFPKTIRVKEGKQFQFNPFAFELAIGMTATAPAESLQPGGTASTTMMTNSATSLKMYFDRSIEVAAATYMATHDADAHRRINGQQIDPDMASIGVQKDVWDVFRICLGGDDDYFAEIGRHLGNIEQISGNRKVLAGSGTDMTSRLFDVGIASLQAWGRPVAVFYNPNMVIAGFVAGLHITYAEFNANYVPTKAIVNLDVSVYSSSSESGVAATSAAAADGGTTTTDGSGGANPDPPDSRTQTTNGSIVTSTSSTATTYRIDGTNIRLDV